MRNNLVAKKAYTLIPFNRNNGLLTPTSVETEPGIFKKREDLSAVDFNNLWRYKVQLKIRIYNN